MKNIIDNIFSVIMKHLYIWQKKTNVHVLAKLIMQGCISSQGLSEYVYISKSSFSRKIGFSDEGGAQPKIIRKDSYNFKLQTTICLTHYQTTSYVVNSFQIFSS